MGTDKVKEAIIRTNLAYLFVDLMESAAMDMNESLKRAGQRLKHEDKRNFNTALAALKRLKKEVDKIPEDEQENYGDSADKIYQIVVLLADRCTTDDNEIKAVYDLLKSFPSRLGLESDDSCF